MELVRRNRKDFGFWQSLGLENLTAYCAFYFRQGHDEDGCRVKHSELQVQPVVQELDLRSRLKQPATEFHPKQPLIDVEAMPVRVHTESDGDNPPNSGVEDIVCGNGGLDMMTHMAGFEGEQCHC